MEKMVHKFHSLNGGHRMLRLQLMRESSAGINYTLWHMTQRRG